MTRAVVVRRADYILLKARAERVEAERDAAQKRFEAAAENAALLGCENADLKDERDRLREALAEKNGKLADTTIEAEAMRVALLRSAAAEARLRMRWPHIEVPTHGSAGMLGRQVRVDPGSPTCLRCSIEDELRGPALASGEEK